MLKFINKDLKEKTRSCLEYLESKDVELERFCGFENISEPESVSNKYVLEEYNDQIIDENYIISVCLDESDFNLEMTLIEFIDLIEETKESKMIKNIKCISNKHCLIRNKLTEINEFEEYMRISNLLEHTLEIFKIESEIKGIKFSCAIKKGITLFGILVHLANNYSDYLPSVLGEDIFIEISFCDERLTEKQIEEIYNAYCFEIGASHGIYLTPSPRPEDDFDEFDYEDSDDNDYILRPLMLGPGMMEIQKLFNQANEVNDNPDYSIIQYTKIIENVSQTVIREGITQLAYTKLMSSKALCPDADYIRELETLFIENKQKYEKDKEAINATIEKCCDIFEISEYAPKFLDKVKNLKENINRQNSKKEPLIKAALESLAEKITATRNSIVHAKANYALTGKECPEEDKTEFAKMLRIVSIQVIRWFANISNSSKIT
ncbi:hypothetical protein [Acetobacterium sp.]|uniref:hypothetical protein n=1 Tax=Acetobacterium sp. TaxID=1872094 RepID=UPI002F40DA80